MKPQRSCNEVLPERLKLRRGCNEACRRCNGVPSVLHGAAMELLCSAAVGAPDRAARSVLSNVSGGELNFG